MLMLVMVGVAHAEPDPAELTQMLVTIDERQQNTGDYKALIFIEQKEAGKSDLVYQAVVYRRDSSDKMVLLFTKPQAEAGKGYLRIDKNLFFYDPGVGRWERRTERERIGGTNSRRQDYAASRMSEQFDATWIGEETLGAFTVHRLELIAREGIDLPYPIVQVWIDQGTGNVLKRQDFSLSRKLMRTSYYPKWKKLFSESKGSEVYFPYEIRIFDELQRDKTTTLIVQEVNLDALPDSYFSKAWLESKSR